MFNTDGNRTDYYIYSNGVLSRRILDELTINDKEPSKRESQIPDQKDAQGNWTRQTKWFTDANGTHPLTVTYRTISYYEKEK